MRRRLLQLPWLDFVPRSTADQAWPGFWQDRSYTKARVHDKNRPWRRPQTPHAPLQSVRESRNSSSSQATNASQAGIHAPCECSRAAAVSQNTARRQHAASSLRCSHNVRHALLQRPQLQKNAARHAVAATPNHTGTSTTSSSAPAAAASRARAARRRMARRSPSARRAR